MKEIKVKFGIKNESEFWKSRWSLFLKKVQTVSYSLREDCMRFTIHVLSSRKIFYAFFNVFLVPTGPLPEPRSDGEPLKDWMIAVIVLVAGLLLLAIVVLALCCFKRRKKEHGGKYKTVWTVVIQEKKLDTSGYFEW